MIDPEQNAELLNSTDAQEVNPNTSATGAETARMFHCKDCNHEMPISEAFYPTKKNPGLCKGCAAKRRKDAKEMAEAEKHRHTQSLEAIPEPSERGDSKRLTISLSQYAIAALEVLAVGYSVSEVAESAVIRYLGEQDSQVIAFVGRVFAQKQ